MTQTTATQPTVPATDVPHLPADRGGDTRAAIASHTILSIWSLIVLVPLVWTVLQSFKTSSEIFASPFALPSHWSFDNYVSAWTTAGIGSYFVNTVVVVGCALFLTMLLGSMSAYALARFEFPGRYLIRQLILAGLTFPIFLAVVPLFFILQGIGLLGTLPGLILTYTAFAYPFTVFFLISYFEELPAEIAEAAAIDGASAWRTFFQIMLPMARPGMASVAILNFVGLWNQFLLPWCSTPTRTSGSSPREWPPSPPAQAIRSTSGRCSPARDDHLPGARGLHHLPAQASGSVAAGSLK